MALSNGPNLGILVDGAIGEVHYDALMQRWRATDALIQSKVKSAIVATPPASPTDGDCYIIPSGATGVWSSNIGKLTRYSSKQSAWEYFTPKNGWFVYNENTSLFLKYDGSAWVDAFGTWWTTASSTFGRTLVNSADASAARTNLGLGSIATQSASSIAVTGGTIDNTAIGNTTRATGKFTTLDANSAFNIGGAGTTNTVTGTTTFTANTLGSTCINATRTVVSTSNATTIAVGSTVKISTEANVTGYDICGSFTNYPSVKSSFTNSGYSRATDMSAIRNIVSVGYDDNGTLTGLGGVYIGIGHYNTSATATPITTTATAVQITPYATTGTISTLYGVSVAAINGSGATNASAIRLAFTSATEAHRNVDAAGTAYNYLNGNTGIGIQPSSGAKLNVAGPVKIGQYTLSTLPSASAFSACLIDVTDATGGPKTCRSDGTNWKILNTTTTVS